MDNFKLAEKKRIVPLEKSGLHPRNRHRFRYDFEKLVICCPELERFLLLNKYSTISIDFSNADAVKTLNKALLKYDYGIANWDIPSNYLCPPIPGRADYLHYLADLLSSSNNGELPKGSSIRVLDVGVGANCVYPIVGHSEYGWHFVGSDIDPIAIQSANKIIASNAFLNEAIEFRQQNVSEDIFKNIIKPDDVFDLSMCNPPFHASKAEAYAGTQRKWTNLGLKKSSKNILNFGGQHNELWCKGGEEVFVRRMIEQSAEFPTQCFWYSALISKSSTLPSVYKTLAKQKAWDIKTINMAQGQKASRIVAWTFLNELQQKDWRLERWS